MIDSVLEFLDRVFTLILLPATLYGAGGALMNAKRTGKPLRQTALEVIGGAITANMLCPVVQDLTPERWHYTLFFLVGWGGLEMVGRLYEVAAQMMERRIKRQIGGGDGE
jgi:hypothetical protein